MLFFEIVNRDGRRVDVAAAAPLEKFGGIAHVARHVARIVDDDVPGPLAFERLQAVAHVPVPVTREFLDLAAEQAGLVAAVEHGDVVAAVQRVVDLVRTEKAGAAEKQDVEFPAGRLDGQLRAGRLRTEDRGACP